MNLCLATDSYKVSHHRQYPPGTEHVYSYFESRGGDYDALVFFGLQYFLLKYLSATVTQDHVDEAAELYAAHFNDPTLFNRAGWERIVHQWGGRLPVSIRAVPEGSVIEPRNVLMTVENTDPHLPWLTNWLETLLSQVWYPCTVATYSRAIRQVIREYLDATGTPALLDFKLHDFGFRGVSSVESAGIGGAAHLVNFKGTDTVAALQVARTYYFEQMAGYSIPAAEHSTTTSWGREHELDAYRNMIQQFGSGGAGLYAVVSDSYDIYHACRNLWGGELLKEVEGAPNTLVIRPDSGVPHQVVPDVISTLIGRFGATRNAKGYDVLNPKVRVIQGDGIDLPEVERILAHMAIVKQSADNVAFGCGGGLLQKHNRDTLKFAFKCSHVRGQGWERDVYKEPVTDSGKNSKRGRLKLVQNVKLAGPRYVTVAENDFYHGHDDVLEEVFRNGVVLRTESLAQIRERATEWDRELSEA